MSRDAEGSRVHMVYRVRSSDQVAVLSATDDPGAEQVVYEGYLLGLDDTFEHATLRMTVPRSVIDRAQVTDVEQHPQVLINDGFLADDVQLTTIPLPDSDSGDYSAMAGAVLDEGEIVDIALIDDPTTIVIVVIGAVTLICLAKHGTSTFLLDRAHARATAAGDKPTLAIDMSTDGEVSTSVGKLGRLKAKLRCRVRGEVRSPKGAIVDSHKAAAP